MKGIHIAPFVYEFTSTEVQLQTVISDLSYWSACHGARLGFFCVPCHLILLAVIQYQPVRFLSWPLAPTMKGIYHLTALNTYWPVIFCRCTHCLKYSTKLVKIGLPWQEWQLKNQYKIAIFNVSQIFVLWLCILMISHIH